jgi:hypothetical protein
VHTVEDYPVPNFHQPLLLNTGAGHLLVVPAPPTVWSVALPAGLLVRPGYPGIVHLQDYVVAPGRYTPRQ